MWPSGTIPRTASQRQSQRDNDATPRDYSRRNRPFLSWPTRLIMSYLDRPLTATWWYNCYLGRYRLDCGEVTARSQRLSPRTDKSAPPATPYAPCSQRLPHRTGTGWRRRASDQDIIARRSPPDLLDARSLPPRTDALAKLQFLFCRLSSTDAGSLLAGRRVHPGEADRVPMPRS